MDFGFGVSPGAKHPGLRVLWWDQVQLDPRRSLIVWQQSFVAPCCSAVGWPGGLIGEPKKSMVRVSFVALFFTPWLWPEHLPDDGRAGAWLQGPRNRSSAGNKSPHQLTWWKHYDRMLS